MFGPGGVHAGFALVPFFLACLAVEAGILWWRERRVPNVGEWLANTGCGVGQLAMRPLYETAIAALYVAVYETTRVLPISVDSIAAWVILFFATDLTYYAYHRLSHHVPIMWAWHGVHHQSSEYDLSVSFRLSWIGGPIERLFYVPFAIIGFPPAMIITLTGISSFYQFFVHTRAIGRLGPLEWIFNTPSHHRVHHGIEPEYVDHNFGGILCIWDRLFGTYVREGAPPTFGVKQSIGSLSPFVANVRYWQDLWRGPQQRTHAARPLDARVTAYVALQLILSMLAVTLVVRTRGVDAPLTILAVAFAVASTATLGAVLDRKPWAARAEIARWVVACVGVGVTL